MLCVMRVGTVVNNFSEGLCASFCLLLDDVFGYDASVLPVRASVYIYTMIGVIACLLVLFTCI